VRSRPLGYVLFCAGAVLVAFAGGRYAHGAWKQGEARRAWDESEARAVVALARRSVTADGLLPAPVVHGAPVARLQIPRLGLDEIVMEGVDEFALNAGPGHLPGSAFPGEQGNAIISAHRDRHFSRLGDVNVGDTVVTESGSHRTRWVVLSKRVIDADAPALFRTADATLTLTTCWPIRYLGTAPERLIVVAKPVGPAKTGTFASANST
jgi:LPXTG-site transpeptidase (sortase) family protein